MSVAPLLPIPVTAWLSLKEVSPPVSADGSDVFKLLAAVLTSLIGIGGFARVASQASEGGPPASREIFARALRMLLGAVILLVATASALYCLHNLRTSPVPSPLRLGVGVCLALIVSFCVIAAGLRILSALHAMLAVLAEDTGGSLFRIVNIPREVQGKILSSAPKRDLEKRG